MRKLVLVLGVFAALTAALSVTTTADDHNDTLNATITPAFVAANIVPSNVNYGILPYGAVQVRPDTGRPNSDVEVFNAGNVPATFQIRGDHTEAWSLAPERGEDEYVHRFDTANQNPAMATPLTLANQTLFSNAVPVGSEILLFLNLDMPTSSATTAQQTATVVVVAVAAP